MRHLPGHQYAPPQRGSIHHCPGTRILGARAVTGSQSSRQIVALAQGSPPTVGDRDYQKIATELVDLEGQLANLFQPGRMMPTAAQVAALRKQVDTKRKILQDYVNGGGVMPKVAPRPTSPLRSIPTTPNMSSTPQPFTTNIPPPPPNYVGPSSDPPPVYSGPEIPAAAPEPPPTPEPQPEVLFNSELGEQPTELQELELENSKLRAIAEQILTKQRQLEDLLDEVEQEEAEMELEKQNGVVEN